MTAPKLTLAMGLPVPGHLLAAALSILEEVGEDPLVILTLLPMS
jgi:hypothetical protein